MISQAEERPWTQFGFYSFPPRAMVLDEKTAKNGTLYVGISMVCITLLKKKVDHGLAAGNALGSLLYFTRPPKTPPPCFPLSLPASTGGGTPWCQWEKGSTPKKKHPPHYPHCLLLKAPRIAPNNTNTTSTPLLLSLPTLDSVAIPTSLLPLSLCPVCRSSPEPNEQSQAIPSSFNSIEVLTYEISNALNCELLILDTAYKRLDEAITALASTRDDFSYCSCTCPHVSTPQRLATGKKWVQANWVHPPHMCLTTLIYSPPCHHCHSIPGVKQTPAPTVQVLLTPHSHFPSQLAKMPHILHHHTLLKGNAMPAGSSPSLPLLHLRLQMAFMTVTQVRQTEMNPRKPYRHMTPLATIIKKKQIRMNSPQSTHKMPKASGVAQWTQKATSSSIYPQTSQNWNTYWFHVLERCRSVANSRNLGKRRWIWCGGWRIPYLPTQCASWRERQATPFQRHRNYPIPIIL